MNILVVDDSLLNLTIAEKYLKECDGVTKITLCQDPKNVMTIIDENKIDILLLDLVMPEITGFDLLKLLRDNKKYDYLYIIMFTSLTDSESFKKCFELGASDYINKPIVPVEFYARIKSAIDIQTKSSNLKEMYNYSQSQYEELVEMNKKLSEAQYYLIQSEKMAAVGQLAAGIAHEINNPMGFVSSNFEILIKYTDRISQYLKSVDENLNIIKENTAEGCKGQIDIIYENRKKFKIDTVLNELNGILSDSQSGIKRVTEIVQSLRTFARTDKEDEKQSNNLEAIINEVILLSRNEIKYVAEVNINVPDDININCNKNQIGQVLINILVNAAQAIKSQKRKDLGHITLSAKKDSENVFIYIEDDGPGISNKHINKIFEPFFTTKDVGKGTGLGLSISYDIITNKHNGNIEVSSEVGKGTLFTIKLPIEGDKDV